MWVVECGTATIVVDLSFCHVLIGKKEHTISFSGTFFSRFTQNHLESMEGAVENK
jgi:hypothetical protein